MTVHRSWPFTVHDRSPFMTVHRSWPFMTVPDRSWPFLTVPDRSWPFLTVPDRSRPFLTVFDCFMSFLRVHVRFLPLIFIIRIQAERIDNDRKLSGTVNSQERLRILESE
jgi:hypothetical protein